MPRFHVETLDGRPPDFQVDQLSDDGQRTARVACRLTHKELANGNTIVLVGDAEGCGRVTVRIACSVLNEVVSAEVEQTPRARLTVSA